MSEEKIFTTVINKYPSYRDDPLKGCWKWLCGRRADDNAEGLWRVHDKLYNFGVFKEIHPGGSEWLTFTEGTDITEAFESHHIRDVAAKFLPKYFVRDASKPRNYKLTFKDDGFYKTLQRRAAVKLSTMDTSNWKSKRILELDLLLMFLMAIFTIRAETNLNRLLFGVFTAQLMAWLSGMSHNFIHQRNSLQMYGQYMMMTGWRDWRIFHVLSHHLYPNTYSDLEISLLEPFFHHMPIAKTKLSIWISWLLSPFVYATVFYAISILRYIGYTKGKQNVVWEDFLPLALPLSMFIFGTLPFTVSTLIRIFITWHAIMLTASLLATAIAINSGHHGPEIVHEGDEFKSLDFGIYQLLTTIDRTEVRTNLFTTLAYFGDHILHHMFPSLDHAVLPQLRDILIQTCIEFEGELREFSLFDAFIAHYQQLGRTETISYLSTRS